MIVKKGGNIVWWDEKIEKWTNEFVKRDGGGQSDRMARES